MKPYFIFLALFFFLLYGPSAQVADTIVEPEQRPAIENRRGQFWLSGGSYIGDGTVDADGGYFLTKNLLIGTKALVLCPTCEDPDFFLSAFMRYYLLNKSWRPYLQAEGRWWITSPRNDVNAYRAALGVEKSLANSSLLNIEFAYQYFTEFEGNLWTLNGRLNTTIGGPAGKKAASSHFKKGSFTLDGDLFAAFYGNSPRLFSSDNLSTQITPLGYYFLSDNIAINGTAFYGSSSRNQLNGGQVRRSLGRSLLLATGFRCYLTSRSLFNIFVEGLMAYEYSWSSNGFRENEDSAFIFNYELGNSLFISQSASFDLGLNGNYLLGSRGSGNGLTVFGRVNFWFN